MGAIYREFSPVPAMERRSELPGRFDEQLTDIFILVANLLLELD